MTTGRINQIPHFNDNVAKVSCVILKIYQYENCITCINNYGRNYVNVNNVTSFGM